MAKVRIFNVPKGEFFGGAGVAVWRPYRNKLTGRSMLAEEPETDGRVRSCEESLLELLERAQQAQGGVSRVERTIQQGPAYELSVSITAGSYGHHLQFVSFVPTARRPEKQIRFQTTLTQAELAGLHQVIGDALATARDNPPSSSGEPAHV